MNLQFYETLQDKSKEYLTYLIEHILPEFTTGELKLFLETLTTKTEKSGKNKKNSKSKLSQEFAIINDDKKPTAYISKLNEKQLKLIYQIFISREINDKFAVKWRFYQYIRYHLGFKIKNLKINQDFTSEQYIDYIIETNENEIVFVSCHDILELNNFKDSLTEITKYAKEKNTIPDKIIFATGKSFRNIPIDDSFQIEDKEIILELWIEWTEENRNFNREDLIVVSKTELKLAGFNFTSSDDLLNYVYQNSNGGQISIYKQSDFFTGSSEEEPEVELIWKGIMIK